MVPGDFPQPPARRLPRHGALGRAPEPIRRWPIHRQHRSTVSLALHRASMKIRRPGPQKMKSHACPANATGTQSSVFADGYAGHACRFPDTLFPRGIERNRQSLLKVVVSLGTLSRRDFISLGFSIRATTLKNTQGGYEVSCFAACAISMSSTVAKIRSCWRRGRRETRVKVLRQRPPGTSSFGGSFSRPRRESTLTFNISANLIKVFA